MPRVWCWIEGHKFVRHEDFLVCKVCGKRVKVVER